MYVLGTEALNPLDAFEECVPPGIPEEHLSHFNGNQLVSGRT